MTVNAMIIVPLYCSEERRTPVLTDGPRTDMLPIIPREPRGGDQLLTGALIWIIVTCLSVAVATFFLVIATH